MRTDLTDGLAVLILVMGIAWGVVALLLGLAGSFTVSSGRDVVALTFGFLIVLPITIAAIWRPKICAALLTVSFFLVEVAGFSDDGLRGVYLVGKKLALPTLMLVCGYLYVAHARATRHAGPPD